MKTMRPSLPVCVASCLLVALALLTATAARAMDDGGGRSVFATGAGNRALGLGGAFCAIADDASVTIWNPGGLGWIDRKQFAVTQTTLFGLGFNEQFASIVVPDYRIGAVSFTLRRFAVDEIEGRDDRGMLTDDDLQDSELEAALGYGHRLGAAASAGVAIKMQRQSLAGFSDSGLGVDLGLLMRPLQLVHLDESGGGLTFGASVRNAIEPTVRLETDNVPDPTALRSGLAYRRHLGAALAMLASVDVEKTRHMGSRLHAGFEAQLEDMLALRVGSFAGTLTAGTSVRWRGLGVDYQFEDNPLGSIHRFGLSVAFGPTVAESEHAARLAESNALQSRLDAAFVKRTQNQADRVMREARRALEDRRWDRVLDLAGTLLVLAPNDPTTPSLMADAWRGRATDAEKNGDLSAAAVSYSQALAELPSDSTAARALARVRRTSAERADRTRDLRARFDAALDAFSRDDLLAAQRGFQEILATSPDDQEAATMLTRTRSAIARRVDALLDQAGSYLAADRLEDAEARIAEVRTFDATSAGAAGVSDQIIRRRTEIARAAAALPTAPEATHVAAASMPEPSVLSPARQREVADLYRRGVQSLDDGRTADAIRYWELVWAADPEFEGVADHLAQEYLAQGMDAFAAGKLNQAVESWEQAVRVAPNDPRARGYLERAHEQLARMRRIGAR